MCSDDVITPDFQRVACGCTATAPRRLACEDLMKFYPSVKTFSLVYRTISKVLGFSYLFTELSSVACTGKRSGRSEKGSKKKASSRFPNTHFSHMFCSPPLLQKLQVRPQEGTVLQVTNARNVLHSSLPPSQGPCQNPCPSDALQSRKPGKDFRPDKGSIRIGT